MPWLPDMLRARSMALVLLAVCSLPAQAERIVTLGGTVTEIVFDLGRGKDVIAVDQSSLYPPQVRQLPSVGYYRQTPVEGVAATRADLVLASENAGPPEALARLRSLGMSVQTMPDSGTVESLYERIAAIAAALGRDEQGRQLAARIQQDLQRAQRLPGNALSTAVLMYRGNQFQLAGEGSSAHQLLGLAGLRNVQHERRSYMTLATEGLAALDPELIVITQASLESVGGMAAFMRLPGVALTRAGRHQRILVMDDLLILGIGPRVAQAIEQLKQAAS